jgi:hypothetical protein
MICHHRATGLVQTMYRCLQYCWSRQLRVLFACKLYSSRDYLYGSGVYGNGVTYINERETCLKWYKRFREPVSKDSDDDDEPISIPTPILEQEKAQRQNERLSIQRDKQILARREKYPDERRD